MEAPHGTGWRRLTRGGGRCHPQKMAAPAGVPNAVDGVRALSAQHRRRLPLVAGICEEHSMAFDTTSPVHFHFERIGGAIVAGRISIWSGVSGARPKRVAVVNFEHPTQDEEDVSVVLAPGRYTCVVKVFVRQDLNGRYGVSLAVDTQDVFGGVQQGDVSTLADRAELLESQFDIDVA